MTTDFFQRIAELHTPGIWKIVIHSDASGNFTVSELFTAECGDKAIAKIIPMNFSGTAEDLDAGFFTAITAPVTETAGLITNMEQHLQSIEQARLASKLEQDRKNKEKAQATNIKKNEDDFEVPKISKEERKKIYDDAMLKIADLRGLMKYAEALVILPSLIDYPEKKTELEKTSADLTRLQKMYDNQLFQNKTENE
jgi:PRTRC genetic system protein E